MSLSHQHQRRAMKFNFNLEITPNGIIERVALRFTTLERHSYLKIDSYYEVPIHMLDEATYHSGNPLMIWAKRRGGLGELRDHVRRRDRFREGEKLYQLMDKQTLEENEI